MATVTDVEQVGIPTRDEKSMEHVRFDQAPAGPLPGGGESPRRQQRVVAMFCYEEPQSAVGRFVTKTALALAERQTQVHIFSRHRFEPNAAEVQVDAVGSGTEKDLIGRVHEFTRRACNSFLRRFHGSTANVTLMGHEWSTVPAISLLHGIKNVGAVLSMQSLERQRSGLDTGISKWIEETELAGMREARSIIVHDPGTAEIIKNCLPECADRIVDVCPGIPMAGFQFDLDPGDVKARFQVGPVDPTILYLGDLAERYGVNLLMKAMPAILRSHGQARCIFVGGGELLWPLRVYSRYLLLDHVVRLAGHLADQPLYELIHAADVIVVPSMEETPWWPIEAAWVANRPVVATCEAAPNLLEHEHDCVLVQPNEEDLAAGIRRVLSDPDFAHAIAHRGHAKLEDRYCDNKVIKQIEQAIGIEVSAPAAAHGAKVQANEVSLTG